MLPVLDVEIGEEHDLEQLLTTRRIAVDDVGDAVNQPDDQLGHAVAGRGLAAEDHRARRAVDAAGAAREPVVERDRGTAR